MRITKQHMLIAINQLPDDATPEDALETLLELRNISNGLQQNERLSQQKVKQHFLKRRKMRQNREGNMEGTDQ